MAQGSLNLKAKKPARVTKKQQNPRPAAPKQILTKKNNNSKTSQKLNKLHTGHLLASTEKLIAGRVGHLELIKGSRRQLERQEKEKAKKAAAKK